MPWLCYLKHNWLYIDGNRRRTCLRCKRYERLSEWTSLIHNTYERYWLEDK